ncbi:MAG: T9SS type A sorting domain-containing protein [Bacteroidia bacterium]|nr:T9SS type A sorting domain-containing protein [Bacteroidia bacterium]
MSKTPIIWGQGANISSKVKQKISFSVYPNPVKDVFFFSAPQLLNEKISIIIFDAIGSPIKSYDNFNVSRKNSVNVGDLVVGAYFVKFICGEFSRVERIVIDK